MKTTRPLVLLVCALSTNACSPGSEADAGEDTRRDVIVVRADRQAPPDEAPPVDVVAQDNPPPPDVQTPPIDVVEPDVVPPPDVQTMDVVSPPVDAPMDAPPADVRADAPPADVRADTPRDTPADVPADAPPMMGPPASMFTVWISRVGDGAMAPSNASSPVVIERRSAYSGAEMGAAIALPVAAAGMQRPFTLSGTASSEGALLRSQDGRFVTMAGYAIAPGTSAVASATATVAPRTVARISGAGAIDTSTTLGMAFSGNNVRSAITTDGTAFWVAGTATGANGGVQRVMLGASMPTQILATPSNVRVLGIFDTQLYASAGTTGFFGLLSVGMGVPTMTGATGTLLTGFASATGPSPYGFAGVRRAAGMGPVDTFYVSDDRAVASGGGVQRWELRGMIWTLATTHSMGISSGVRGLAAQRAADGSGVTIVAVTGETSSRVVAFDENAMGMAGAARTISTAPMNTIYRGVALAPTE